MTYLEYVTWVNTECQYAVNTCTYVCYSEILCVITSRHLGLRTSVGGNRGLMLSQCTYQMFRPNLEPSSVLDQLHGMVSCAYMYVQTGCSGQCMDRKCVDGNAVYCRAT